MDKHFGMSAHSFRGVEEIQTEIFTNGPVEGTMRVYEDFLPYKSGQSEACAEFSLTTIVYFVNCMCY